ncbi:hypothetical protein A3860_27265 [Niastella vici]|uniref:Uncharacterized protein n=1 Tax=Niastella vici TaxID=1703345 RepID=A0A1V9FWI2_9BACT|nr:hypothetical protein A3860_27265 [Niastella vici]
MAERLNLTEAPHVQKMNWNAREHLPASSPNWKKVIYCRLFFGPGAERKVIKPGVYFTKHGKSRKPQFAKIANF